MLFNIYSVFSAFSIEMQQVSNPAQLFCSKSLAISVSDGSKTKI